MKSFRALSELTIFIIGSTGSGKSKLAIDLALKLNGEVINADAMQLYRGLDIITNKPSDLEISSVPHHLLGTLSFQAGKNFNVHSYRSQAYQIIENIRSKNHVPIIVGGTHYYIEALLYKDFLNNKNESENNENDIDLEFDGLDSHDLYEKLKRYKPEIAVSMHPNELRKIRSALKNFKDPHKSKRPIDLKYKNPIIFWLDCSNENDLNEFLDRRVESMLEKGLLDELDIFTKTAINEFNYKIEVENSADLLLHKDEENEEQRRGILQSIGFKEFRRFLKLNECDRISEKGKFILEECVSDMKLSTRRYAKRQRRWIKARFLRRPREGSTSIYKIDVAHIIKESLSGNKIDKIWHSEALSPSFAVINGYLDKELEFETTWQPLKSELILDIFETVDQSKPSVEGPPFICHTCDDRYFYDIHSYSSHMKGKRHHKRLQAMKRKHV